MKRKIRVVIDTNVIISGIIGSGTYTSKIINTWLERTIFEPFVSKALQEEINNVFARPKLQKIIQINNKDLKIVLGRLFNLSTTIKPKKIENALFSDSKDHFLLELAIAAKADVIVSGDLGILTHFKYENIEFINPEEFCRKYKIK